MGQRHFVTIHGQRYSLEALQHGAHRSLSTQTVIGRLRQGIPLARAKRLPRKGYRRPPRFAEAVAAYLQRQPPHPEHAALAAGLLLASLTLLTPRVGEAPCPHP